MPVISLDFFFPLLILILTTTPAGRQGGSRDPPLIAKDIESAIN